MEVTEPSSPVKSSGTDNSLKNPSLPAPRSHIIPQTVPITFIGLPYICRDVWHNMAARGTRNFDRWFRGNDPGYQHGLMIFQKIVLYAALAKLQIAQKKGNCHPEAMALINSLTHQQLDILTVAVSRLPRAIAMYLDSIGNCTVDGLSVTPRLSRHETEFAAHFSVTELDNFLNQHNQPQIDEPDFIAIRERTSSLITWTMAVGSNQVAYQISANDIAIFSGFPTPVQISAFCQIIDTFTSIPSYLTSCDISHGNGASNQCVRVISDITHERQDYYIMCEVASQEEVLGCVFHLGQDIPTDNFSL